jgi:hypothetical protein
VPCKYGDDCRYKAHSKTNGERRDYICPYNHHTKATIIPKGEPIPDWLCPYDKVTFVDGKLEVEKCRNKACEEDHLENHVPYCKGSGVAAMPTPQQQVQLVYVLPNGQMMGPPMMGPPMMGPPMMGPPMMGPPTMPQFSAPRFYNKQNKPRPPPPTRTPPKPRPPPPTRTPPKPKKELSDAEFDALVQSEPTKQENSEQEDEPSEDEMSEDEPSEDEMSEDEPSEDEMSEDEPSENAILSRAVALASTQ